MSLVIYYDGDCPFCTRYVRFLRLREVVGTIDLCNVRDDAARRDALVQAGFNLDHGMVVDLDGKRLGGSDAIHVLACLSTPNNAFNRMNRWLFSSAIVSRFVYPLLRCGRWLALFMLGRTGIHESDGKATARATLFSIFFAFFSIFHTFNYAFEYGRFPPQWDQYALVLSALFLLLRPGQPRALFLLMVVSTFSAIIQAPITSNHTMVRNFALVGYWLSFALAMLRGDSWSRIFTSFATAGQGVLIVMYVFGIFHKLNTDFLNPVSSCAVTLWQQMPLPLRLFDTPAVHYLTIYGTFVVEGAIIVMLLWPRFRHFGIICGILFHLLLAVSNYAMYISFTTLSIALHCLFVGGESARRIVATRAFVMMTKRIRHLLYIIAFAVLMFVCALLAVFKNYTGVSLAGFAVILPFCWVMARFGMVRPVNDRVSPWQVDHMPAAIVTLAFFVNCSLPYLGLKSAQAINMFANIRLEAGVSNHLLFPDGPGPFTYLDDVVIVESVENAPKLAFYAEGNFALVYYDLLDAVERSPQARVTYWRDGQRFEHVTASDLANDINRLLHPRWVRKWFHFQPVKLDQPELCNV